MNALKQPKFVGILWLLARLWLGYEWLYAGIEKAFGEGSVAWVGPKAGAAVTGFLKGAIAKSPLAEGFDPIKTPHPAVQQWYAELVQNVFLPNATLFSYLVAYGEVLVGIALILGVFTRFSALMGVVMALAFMFAGSTSTLPQLLVVGMVILFAGPSLTYYALDRFLRPIEYKLLDTLHIPHAPLPQTA